MYIIIRVAVNLRAGDWNPLHYSGIWTLARKMTSFWKHFCAIGLRLQLEGGLGLRLEFSGNTFKSVFGQMSIRASIQDPIIAQK